MEKTSVGHRTSSSFRIIGAWMAKVGTLSMNSFIATYTVLVNFVEML